MHNRSVWEFFWVIAVLAVLGVIAYQYMHKSAPTQPGPVTNGTISGRVTSSQLCHNPGGLQSTIHCDSLSYTAQVSAIRKSTNEIVDTEQTDARGMYTLSVPPGTYVIRSQGSRVVPKCPDELLRVESGDHASLDIACDIMQ
jgi:hypothetical protein